MQVARWGNSLAIRIPAAIVHILDLKEGDDLKIVAGGTDTLKVEHTPERAAMLERLREFRGRLPEGWKFDREEANER